MKKILILALMVITCHCGAFANTTPDNTFTLQGKFISEHSVNYEVYQITSEKTLELVNSGCALKFFDISVEVGNEYIIKFISRENLVKSLHIKVVETGGFGIDVDFNSTSSAKLVYNSRGEYDVRKLDVDDLYSEYIKE